MRRSALGRLVDAVTFPLRALTLFDEDHFGLSSLRSERFDYVADQSVGWTLDFGCGPGNRFVSEFLGQRGVGIDVFPYQGLTSEQIVEDPTSLPFHDGEFDTVCLIACINHIPRSKRPAEIGEAWRVTRPGGVIIVTMGNPVAEVLVHKLVAVYDRVFHTHHDVDGERGMEQDEEYYLRDNEIRSLLVGAGYDVIRRRRFWTQWGLNHLLVGRKPAQALTEPTRTLEAEPVFPDDRRRVVRSDWADD